MNALDALREASGVLDFLRLLCAPAWLIEGQEESVRTLTARVEGIGPSAVGSDVQLAAATALDKADRKAASVVRPWGYEGPGLLNQ